MTPALRTDLLPSSLPTFWLAVIVLLALAAWCGLHARGIRRKQPPALRFVTAAPVGALAVWLALQLAARWIHIATPWPLWTLALVWIGAVEGAVLIYHHERMIFRPAARRFLLALRLGAIAAICLMLTQPVLHHSHTRRIPRRVAILIDDSGSMHRVDTFWTEAETLDVAQALGALPAGRRPLRLADATNQTFRTRLAYWHERLDTPEAPAADVTGDSLHADAAAAADWLDQLAAALDATDAPTTGGGATDADAAHVDAFRRRLLDETVPALRTLERGSPRNANPSRPADGAETRDIQVDLAAARNALDALHEALPDARAAADARLLATLDEATRAAITEACTTTRFAIARHLLEQSIDGREPFLERLRRRYDVECHTFNRTVSRMPDASTDQRAATPTTPDEISAAVLADQSETDITHAIETVIAAIPSEERAGILLLTDGRHTGASGVEALARHLGQTQTPVSSIVIGGTQTPFDFAIADVRAAESIFLGDRVRITATVSATQATGAQAHLTLLRNGEIVDEQEKTVDSIDWQESFRLEDTPDAPGMYHYTLVLEEDPREAVDTNNRWDMNIAVSENRTHVLLVDQRPRWEFRYLRNLFYGRDKSIHLQYVLIEPDAIRGLDHDPPLPPASASRPFGEAEAGALPATRDEWRKFDVIILGDLDENTLTPEAVADIHHCVETRGALLVCIAGPHAMPLNVSNTVFQSLLPIVITPGTAMPAPAEQTPFTLQITPAGRTHPVMSLSSSSAENDALWTAMADWHWRLPIDEIKPGAEILAVAAGENGDADETFLLDAASARSPEAARRAFAERRRQETRQAVIVAQPYGLGKVLMLLSDRTWRLRYCVGDTHHHRFWGQVMRWGAGERLRAGNLHARMGTDRISYTPGEPIFIRARLADTAFTPLTRLAPQAIIRTDDGREWMRLDLDYQAGSSGLYEARLPGDLPAGTYAVDIDVPGLAAILGDAMPESLGCGLTVIPSRQPREFAHLTADHGVPRLLATRSGGLALTPPEIDALETAFGEPSRTRVETREIPVWSTPWILLILLSLLTMEWLIRKKGGLA